MQQCETNLRHSRISLGEGRATTWETGSCKYNVKISIIQLTYYLNTITVVCPLTHHAKINKKLQTQREIKILRIVFLVSHAKCFISHNIKLPSQNTCTNTKKNREEEENQLDHRQNKHYCMAVLTESLNTGTVSKKIVKQLEKQKMLSLLYKGLYIPSEGA